MNYIGLLTFVWREVSRMFRVSIQTLATPLVTAILYIFIFGSVVGRRIDLISGVTYIDFVLPGIVMMNIIMAAFSHTSTSIYFSRFIHSIEEILVSPLSYFEMILGFAIPGVVRGLVVGIGVYVLALYFTTATIEHFGLFMLYATTVALIFSLLGMLVGLFSNHFEHLAILNTFVIMPFIFLGGVFNSITMLPGKLQAIIRFNPFFYFVDGIRFAMIGIREANAGVGAGIIIVLVVVFGFMVWYLFKIGYRIKT